MIHPIPSGTRDVLPDEMREQRAITDAIRQSFDHHGYGEVWTPAIEYEAPGARAGAAGVYRLFDDHGAVLTLRSDLTVPIARVAATRYAQDTPPLRLSAIAHVYRAVRPHRGQMREFLQAGCELIGVEGADGTAEILTVACRTLEAVGLHEFRLGIGDASLYPWLLGQAEVDDALRERLLAALVARDLVGLERLVAEHGLDPALGTLPQQRGDASILPEGATVLRELHEALPADVAARVIYDLGLVRDLHYYTGMVFEVYDAGAGAPLGGGGRYDDLLARFGRPEPAVGFALGVDRVHEALTR